MDKDQNKEIKKFHSCLSARGNGPGCEKCSIHKKGFCNLFCNFLGKKIRALLKKQFAEEAVGDICSTFASTAQQRTDRFRGTTKGEYISYIQLIYRSAYSDYFRKTPLRPGAVWQRPQDYHNNTSDEKIRIVEFEETVPHNDDVVKVEQKLLGEQFTERLSRIIQETRDDILRECVKLFFLWLERARLGKLDREIAEELGIFPNTLTKRMIRCYKRIAGHLGPKEEWL